MALSEQMLAQIRGIRDERNLLRVENAKLKELLFDCWDFSHLMHEVMAARFYELGLIDDDEARELGVEVD